MCFLQCCCHVYNILCCEHMLCFYQHMETLMCILGVIPCNLAIMFMVACHVHFHDVTTVLFILWIVAYDVKIWRCYFHTQGFLM